ncbi:ATP-binding protein [Microbacterium sp. NPDC097977]|uniref:AAA family ATPase n=1 Tax=Microbacterium sp. NPDC097977 TaxID=3155686 RepID=UPI0033263604
MEHFPIVTSLVRVALGNDSERLNHQVQRLVDALVADGDSTQAAALSKLLNRRTRSTELAPSRLTRSGQAPTHIAGLEQLHPQTAVPVDKDSSAPLATIIMPDDVVTTLPLFPAPVQDNIDALLMEWMNADRIREAGLSPSPSLLVYGAPGTGKTTLALWLAQQLGRPVVLARLDGLISSFLGTTARNLGALFAFANRYDCVLVLDEFDAIAKVRDDPNEVGEIKRVVNALLQNLDVRVGRGVTVALTNHEALLDPAIWRRFEVQLAVPKPAFAQRVQIALRSLDAGEDNARAEALLLAWVADGLSGAELRTLATKYRKRRLFVDAAAVPPAATIAQVADSTSVHIGEDVLSILRLEPSRQLKPLHAAGFSHADLAYLFDISTKTVQRRVTEE